MSSYNNKTYILFLDLPVDIRLKIDSVRKKYSINGHRKWPSHITFKQDEDFLISDGEIKKITKEFFKKMKPIEIKLDGLKIKHLENGSWNIYISVSNDQCLKDSIKQFSKLMEKHVDSNSPMALGSTKWEQSEEFYTHISLKGGIEKKLGNDLFNKMSDDDFKINFPIDVTCKSITLAKWNNNRWKRVTKFYL